MTFSQLALIIIGAPMSVGMVWACFTIEPAQED